MFNKPHGNKGLKRTKETKLKISLAHKGKKHTEETKLKISLAHKKYYETHDIHNKGKNYLWKQN